MFEEFFQDQQAPHRVRFVSHNLLSSLATAHWLKPHLPPATRIDFDSNLQKPALIPDIDSTGDAVVVLDLDYLNLRAADAATLAQHILTHRPVVGISAVEGNYYVDEFSRHAPDIPIFKIHQLEVNG